MIRALIMWPDCNMRLDDSVDPPSVPVCSPIVFMILYAPDIVEVVATRIIHQSAKLVKLVIPVAAPPGTLGRDLMRERTRSRIQVGGPQKRSANTVPFLPFNTDFSTINWYPGKLMFRVNTCDIKFNRICLLLLLSSVWNLTQDARTNLIWCANVHCIKTTDARTNIKMR